MIPIRLTPRAWCTVPGAAPPAVAALLLAILTAPAEAQESRFAQTHSRSQYVHHIELYDASNRRIDPADPNARPYSPMHTCSKCHNTETISHGYHFNAANTDAVHGRRGEPWVFTERRSGSQIPLSYRGWEGTLDPREIGMSDFEFVKEFGRHMPGGGVGLEPADDEGEGRWNLAGQLSIDCMICHSADRTYRHEVWADQLAEENFAWAPAAALGLARIEGSVRRLPDEFDPEEAEEDGAAGRSLPRTHYHEHRFDDAGEIFFDIVRRPTNNACYACHTTRRVGEDAPPKFLHDEDVHIRAGMACADCHRNDISHHISRGFEGEINPAGFSVETLSCSGCHEGAGDPEVYERLGGRMGAPKPIHRGIPPLHFEKMSCTSCHAGPPPQDEALRVQTSLAHALGLPTQRRTADEPPGIAAPVFIEDQSGKIAPHKQVWPAYWGRMREDGGITVIPPEEAYMQVRRALRVRSDFMSELAEARLTPAERGDVLGEDRARARDLTDEEEALLTESARAKAIEEFGEKLVAALGALAGEEPGEPVYISAGRVHRLAADGETIEAIRHDAAEPYSWPIGHDVRPARQALGARGCNDCHTADAPFYYGEVTALGQAPDPGPVVTTMHGARELDERLLAAWAGSFQGRDLFKWIGFIGLAIVALVVLLYGLIGFTGLLRMCAPAAGRGPRRPAGALAAENTRRDREPAAPPGPSRTNDPSAL